MTTAIPATLPAEFQDQVVQIVSELGVSGYVRLVLDYPGPLDPARLETALRRLLDAEPVLGCRFALEDGQALWRRRDDLDAIAGCPVLAGDDLEATTQAWLAERFDPWQSPNLGIALVRSPAQAGDRLLLRVSHVVADGTAALDVAMALTDLYSRLGDDPDYQPSVNTASRDSLLWLANFKFRDKLGLLLDDLKSLPAALGKRRGLSSTPARFQADAAQLRPRYRTLRLDETRLAAIDRYARAHSATLNDLCLAAFFRAFDEFCPGPAAARLEVVMPTNLRRYAPLQRRPALRNLAGTTAVRIGTGCGASFEDTLAQVQAETLRHKRRLLGTEGQIATLLLARAGFDRKRGLIRRQILADLNRPAPPVLTHFGHTPARRYACDGMAPVGLAAFGEASPVPVFLSALVRMDDRLCVGVCYDQRLGDLRVDAFLKCLEQNLPGSPQHPIPEKL
ncbi:Uncharacterized protein, contains a NRPS condensation (elongation) domain [Methylomagnum ishizawai]|uniref:Uncharacterized protein, contains a NRPS condensation (Elongation) domain n=1 Tax=Methylomagnum ishizawai TaxID=1760988 RepID=A0A1Y6DCR0_9GAMM|nr:hypothetical protein [Methylomagnum ishizawai]SMF97335.1 Uncharacterized protein, contains a NRPS condensation (elongation) domain [Methylomagnum ishizawai]